MALKDTWKDLQDAVQGVPDSGDDTSAEPINDIAHAVIDLEDNINKKEDKSNKVSGIFVDDEMSTELYPSNRAVTDYISRTLIPYDMRIDTKEDVSNKVTKLSENATDEQYPSAKAVKNYVDSSIQSAILDSWEVSV